MKFEFWHEGFLKGRNVGLSFCTAFCITKCFKSPDVAKVKKMLKRGLKRKFPTEFSDPSVQVLVYTEYKLLTYGCMPQSFHQNTTLFRMTTNVVCPISRRRLASVKACVCATPSCSRTAKRVKTGRSEPSPKRSLSNRKLSTVQASFSVPVSLCKRGWRLPRRCSCPG